MPDCRIPDMGIRKATREDIPRIAEILVFSKRKNYRSIFHNDMGSFVDLQVYSLARSYFDHPEQLAGILVYDDKFVKGFISVDGYEIKDANENVVYSTTETLPALSWKGMTAAANPTQLETILRQTYEKLTVIKTGEFRDGSTASIILFLSIFIYLILFVYICLF